MQYLLNVYFSPHPVQDLPPTFYIEPESQEVPIGGSVNLTCAAAGRPKPDMLWRKDGEEISATYVHEDGTSVLTLDDLEETANYTCFAFSKVGFAVSSAQITVINTTGMSSFMYYLLVCLPSHWSIFYIIHACMSFVTKFLSR